MLYICTKNQHRAQSFSRFFLLASLLIMTFSRCQCLKHGSVVGTSASSALDMEKKIVTMNFQEEPRSIDAQKTTDEVGIFIDHHVMEGLYRKDQSGNPVPGMAESYEQKSPTQYIFKLRAGIQWSDGQPVTAADFVYSWQRALDPQTASEYAFFLYKIKNAEAINSGKMPVDKLGAKAIDANTLEVELESPTAYFLKLTTFPTLYPVRQDIVAKFGTNYAADADKMVYNGAFLIAEWKHNASMRFVKNPNYWNKDEIHLTEINMPYLIKDENSEYNMFKDGKYAITNTLPKDQLHDAQVNKLPIKTYNEGGLWFFECNTKRNVTGNQNFRKALQVAINRAEYLTQIHGIPGAKPVMGVIPTYMPAVNASYGEEYPYEIKDADIAKAKEYLEKAKQELSVVDFPELTILANENNSHRRAMEYFQRYFKEKLGLNFKLDFQTFKVRLEKMTARDFDLVWAGWGPDYLDPMTFADLYTSWNGNNRSGWKSERYDKLIQKAMSSLNAKERLDAMNQADQMIMEEAPIITVFQNTRAYLIDPRLTGVIRQPAGANMYFYYARLEEKKG